MAHSVQNFENRETPRNASGSPPLRLVPLLREIRERCTQCGACTRECAFLAHYGLPGAIVSRFDWTLARHQAISYQCSLCGLCTTVCPEKLDMQRLFLEMRRLYVERGHFKKSVYRKILGYEKRGTSALFSWYGLPESCDTIFFPGCNLPGSRPEVTRRMFRHLQQIIPGIGIVLDCCCKPSHDLGRRTIFESVFGEMIRYLEKHGVKTVLTACPNCFTVFRNHGNGIAVKMVYEVIHKAAGLVPVAKNGQKFTVHDSCALRNKTDVHQTVRDLITVAGGTITEMKHHGRRTVCCGEGGMTGFSDSGFADNWSDIRSRESNGCRVITYCAGCSDILNRVVSTVHLADLLYRPEVAANGNLKIARAPFTYLNRLVLKARLKKELNPKTSRVRRIGSNGSGPPAGNRVASF